MARLTPQEGIEKFFSATYPTALIRYNPDEHHEWVKDVTTGLVGAMIQLRLPSLSAPEMGIPLPMFATNVENDLLRIVVDPIFQPLKEKGLRHYLVTALAYTGEMMILDTTELHYLNYVGLVAELHYQYELFTSLDHYTSS